MNHDHSKPLTYQTEDSLGLTPDLMLLHSRWRHSGNKVVYEIVNFQWDGETDRWQFVMRSTAGSGVFVARPLEHLEGRREGGSKRYERVDP